MMKNLLTLLMTLVLLVSVASVVACEEKDVGEGETDPYLVLVNKQNAVDDDYVPDELIDVDTVYTTGGKVIQLNRVALLAATDMLDAMYEDGITNVTITSAYRTYDYQKKLFDGYIAAEKEAHPDWTDDRVRQEVLTYSAAPGTSEHQTGLCVDLFTTDMAGLYNFGTETPKNPYDKGFAETAAYEWLCENAHKYGFILRFPENKTDVTGYSYESWHYRYVGVEHATQIHEQNLTLEEYLNK